MMARKLLQWALRPAQRITISQDDLLKDRSMAVPLGVAVGIWDEAVAPEMTVKYRGLKGRPWHEFRNDPSGSAT